MFDLPTDLYGPCLLGRSRKITVQTVHDLGKISARFWGDYNLGTTLAPTVLGDDLRNETDILTMTVTELEPQIAVLSRSEKAHLLQILARDIADAWPGIEKTPDVVGGEACIVRTRIPVWVLVNYRRLGWSEARILDNYPTLRAVDLVNAWAYADSHCEEMDRAIQANEAA